MLLKKVEEIFLYIFDFDKAIKSLKNNDQLIETKLNEINKENETLKNKVDYLEEENILLKQRFNELEKLVKGQINNRR